MKDDKGLYYYPYPNNKQTRMYVKKSEGQIWFRLWSAAIPELWDEHGWVPYDAIRRAADMHKRGSDGFDPKRAYDISIAERLFDEDS